MSTEDRWLTIPELVEILEVGVSKIRRMIEDHHLLARKVDGVWQVPAVFLRDGEILPELQGTLILLADARFTDEEAMEWLLTDEPSLGTTPVAALQAGRKAEVRRIAQVLA